MDCELCNGVKKATHIITSDNILLYVCKEHGYITGEHPQCPTCNSETEVYSRIVGYFRPVAKGHAGKQEEFKERVTYEEKKSLASEFAPTIKVKT